MWAVKIPSALVIYLLENEEIEAFLTPGKTVFVHNIQTRKAFIVAFTSEK
jgi:hypothetical protein